MQRERLFYAVCDSCRCLIPGLLVYKFDDEQYCIIDFDSELAKRIKEHHNSLPYAFGHNLFRIFLLQSDAEKSSRHEDVHSNGFLVVSRASFPSGEVIDD